MPGFDYSKWDKIELSDDEDDVHPNIDKDSWFRLKHRTRVEKEEDDAKKQKELEGKRSKLRRELDVLGEAGREHEKGKKLQKEIDKIDAELEKMEKEKKLNADNICTTTENRVAVSASKPEPKPEPRLQGEAVAQGYCEFIEAHEDLLEEFISYGAKDMEANMEFLKQHGETLLQGEHAESYLLLDCLEKEMNGHHSEMLRSARQNQILTQLREFSRASRRPVMDAVHPVFTRLLENEEVMESFDSAVRDFQKRVEARAVVKRKEMDEEALKEAAAEADNPLGPGGLDPMEVLHTLPMEMQEAFRNKDIQRLQAALAACSDEEAKHHLRRCEASGLWVPHPLDGPPPYRQ